VELGEAAGLLAEAKVLLGNGNPDGGGELVGRSVELAEAVTEEASVLRDSALSYRDSVFRVSVLGSLVGVPVFLFFMWFLWRRFRRRYVRGILGLRPEVSDDAKA